MAWARSQERLHWHNGTGMILRSRWELEWLHWLDHDCTGTDCSTITHAHTLTLEQCCDRHSRSCTKDRLDSITVVPNVSCWSPNKRTLWEVPILSSFSHPNFVSIPEPLYLGRCNIFCHRYTQASPDYCCWLYWIISNQHNPPTLLPSPYHLDAYWCVVEFATTRDSSHWKSSSWEPSHKHTHQELSLLTCTIILSKSSLDWHAQSYSESISWLTCTIILQEYIVTNMHDHTPRVYRG